MTKKYENARSTHSVIAISSISAALLMPLQASAQEVTLQSTTNDSISMTGDFVSFEDNIYTLNSDFGVINIRAVDIECIGEACPIIVSADAEPVITGPLVWNVSLWGSRRALTEHVEKLAELVNEKTDGDFILNLTYGGLSAPRENLDGIAAGSFEMAQFCAGYHPDKNRALNVLELPFLGVSSIEQELAVSLAIYEHPFTISEMATWNATLLMPSPQPQQNIMGTGQPPTSLADFEGMPIRAVGGIGDAVSALGAVPMNIVAPQAGEALATGEIRAASFAPHAHVSFKTIDSGSWWTTNLNPGTTNCPIVMNTQALDDLSPARREALLSSVDEAVEHYVDYYTNVTLSAWYPALQEQGVIELTFGDEILSTINTAVAAPTAAAWIADNTLEGVPAQELYDVVTDTLEQFQ